MFTQKKYWNHLVSDQFDKWKDVPQTEMYALDVLVKGPNGKFISRMQWEGIQPDRGVQYIEHYQSCKGCQHNAHEGRAYAVLLFCGNRFVYGFNLRDHVVISHNEDYKRFLVSLM